MTKPSSAIGGLFVLLLVCNTVPTAAAPTSKNDANESRTPRGRYAQPIAIVWSADMAAVEEALADEVDRMGISTDTSVTLHVQRFNFLHYTIKYVVKEEVTESYALLDGLWKQILGLRVLPAESQAKATAFDTQLLIWRRQLERADGALTKKLQQYAGNIALSETEVKDVGEALTYVGLEPMGVIESDRQKTLDAAVTSDDLVAFERVDIRHRVVADRLASFVTGARLVKDGQHRVIGQKAAGSRVTISLTPEDRNQAPAGEPLTVSYFVRSTRPLVFHLGYTHGRLKDFEFEKVRALVDKDLFSLVKKNEGIDDMTGFLSYELKKWGAEGQYGLLGTLGTGMRAPGSRLYVGAGLRLMDRIVLGVGGVSGTVAEGAEKVVESLGERLGARELFATISRRRDWAPFFGFSLRVY